MAESEEDRAGQDPLRNGGERGGKARPGKGPDPALSREDRRTLLFFLLFLSAMAFLGAALLLFSIWVDWV